MNDFDLSIVILSFNTRDITDECLSRVKAAVFYCHHEIKNRIEVIVVDNASSDGSAKMIERKYPWVKLIKSSINRGYSGGNNLALKKVKSPYILLLNSDVYMDKDVLVKSLQYFNGNYNCDVLGPKLKFAGGKLQPSAGNLPTPENTISWILGLSSIPYLGSLTSPFHPMDKSFFQEGKQVGWVTGAFFMMKRIVYREVGGFDERVFMYMDEVELCKRIKKAGFNIWFVPTISVTHLHRASSKSNPDQVLVSELKGIRYYFQKYYKSSYGLVKVFLILGLILRVVAFSLLGKTSRAKAYIDGLGVI